MWSELRARLLQAVADVRRRRAPQILAAVRDVTRRLPALQELFSARASRPQLTRLRIVRPGNRPMRVVFERAIVHEKYSIRARVLQRGARLVLKPLMAWVPLNDRTVRALRR